MMIDYRESMKKTQNYSLNDTIHFQIKYFYSANSKTEIHSSTSDLSSFS